MFLRLLYESFARQRRRKLLAGLAILLGTTAVTAMLALALSIGDRIHQELAVYGANIIVYPKADTLSVNIAGQDLKPATGGTYLKEHDLEKLKTIFWANNITGLSPELDWSGDATRTPDQLAPTLKPVILSQAQRSRRIPSVSAPTQLLEAPQPDLSSSPAPPTTPVKVQGLWFNHTFGNLHTGAPQLHPWWHLAGKWPKYHPSVAETTESAVGAKLARQLHLNLGDTFTITTPALSKLPFTNIFEVTGIVTSGDETENLVLIPIEYAQLMVNGTPSEHPISRVKISARTKPEDAFARQNPDTLSPAQHEIWYCRPYANSIAYQIREAIPGAAAEQVRRVEQSEGTVLSRISGLMWLISAAALLAAGFAVSASMATAVLERRREIGLMRSLGASRSGIATLFYAESGLLAVAAGTIGYLAGSVLAHTLGAHIFPGEPTQLFIPVLLPITLALALTVAVAGSTPSIRQALSLNPSTILRDDR